MASNAAGYADQIAARIEREWASEAPFGYVNDYDGSTADELDEIPDFDADEHDADNLPGHWRKADGRDYIGDALDIRFLVSSDRSYRSAEVIIGMGGPNAWIDLASREVVVTWWSEPERRPIPRGYCDALDEGAEEIWEMGA